MMRSPTIPPSVTVVSLSGSDMWHGLGDVTRRNRVRVRPGFYLVKRITASSAVKCCTVWSGKARSCSAGACLMVTLTSEQKPETPIHHVIPKWQWRSPVFKWRAGCAEKCTCGSERRGREIVRLRPASYSTLGRKPLVLSGSRYGSFCP